MVVDHARKIVTDLEFLSGNRVDQALEARAGRPAGQVTLRPLVCASFSPAVPRWFRRCVSVRLSKALSIFFLTSHPAHAILLDRVVADQSWLRLG